MNRFSGLCRMITVLCDVPVVRADPMATVGRAVCLARPVWLETVESSIPVDRPLTDVLTVPINARSARHGLASYRRDSRKMIPGEYADASFQILEKQAAASQRAVKAAGQKFQPASAGSRRSSVPVRFDTFRERRTEHRYRRRQ